MFNSSLDALGSAKGQAGTAASKIALVNPAGLKAVDTADNNQVDKATLTGAVNKLNEYVAPALQTIEFSLDQESERMIVKVVDTATQKVLRQIPNEEVLAMSKTLDKLKGLVIRQTV
jgi:flagellar protein FlaG